MPTSDSATFAAAAALLVAVVAGLFSIFNLLVAKDQKISEFRHEWISELRKDFGLYVAYTMQFVTLASRHTDPKFATPEIRTEVFVQLNQAQTRIKLRLNKSKPKQNSILQDIAKIEARMKNWQAQGDWQELDAASQTLVENFEADCQILIKEQWQRVKGGEPIYKIAKWFIFGFSSTTFILLLFLSIMKFHNSYKPPKAAPGPVPQHTTSTK